MTRALLLLALVAGCRDYDALNRVDDLAAPGDDGGVGDGAVPTPDLAMACLPFVYDRDMGTPLAMGINWDPAEHPLAAAAPQPTGTPLPPTSLSIADVEGDGYADVVTGAAGSPAQLAFFKGSKAGLGAVWTAQLTELYRPTVLLANVVGDQAPEIVVGDDALPKTSTFTLYRVDSKGPTPLTGSIPVAALVPAADQTRYSTWRVVSLAAADLDGNGSQDLVIGINHFDNVQPVPYPLGGLLVVPAEAWHASAGLFPYDVDATVTRYRDIPQANPGALAVADLDGDCRPEIAVGGVEGSATQDAGTSRQFLSVYRATGALAEVGTLEIPGAIGEVVSLDLFRTSRRTLLLPIDSTLHVVYLDGNGQLQRSTLLVNQGLSCGSDASCMTGLSSPVVGDFDRDGAEDLFVWGFYGNYGTVPHPHIGTFFRNDSLGGLGRTPAIGPVAHQGTNAPWRARAGDFDGDQRLDIAFFDGVGPLTLVLQQ